MDWNSGHHQWQGREIPVRTPVCGKAAMRDCLTTSGRSRYLLRYPMWKAAVALLLFCASASRAGAESLRLPLMHEPARAVRGVSEFIIPLPRHIAVLSGSQLTLVVHLRIPPGPLREPLSLNVNGQDLPPRFTADAPSFALR